MPDNSTPDNLLRFTKYLELAVRRNRDSFIKAQRKSQFHEIPIGDFKDLPKTNLIRNQQTNEDHIRILQSLELKPIDKIIFREHLIYGKTFQEISDNSPALFGHWRSAAFLQKRYYRARQSLIGKGGF